MICPFCKKEISNNAKFCAKCGHLIPRCPSCGKIVEQKIKFCKYDGTPLPEELVAELPEVSAIRQTSSDQYTHTDQNSSLESSVGWKEAAGYKELDVPPKKSKGPVAALILIMVLLIGLIGFLAYSFFTDSFFFADNNNVVTEKSEGDADNSSGEGVISIAGQGGEKDSSESAPEENTGVSPESADGIGSPADSQSADNSQTDSQAATNLQGETDTATNAQTDSNITVATTEEANKDPVFEKAKSYNKSAVSYNGHAYAIFNIKDEDLTSFNAAENFCEGMGGHLAVINSKEENDFIYRFIQDSGLTLAFFGYTDQNSEGNWKWVDGSDSTYVNWSPGQPNNGSKNKSDEPENYAEFFKETADGTWNDAIFGINTYRFVCEWE